MREDASSDGDGECWFDANSGAFEHDVWGRMPFDDTASDLWFDASDEAGKSDEWVGDDSWYDALGDDQ